MEPIKLLGPNKIEDEILAGDMWQGFTVVGSAGGDDPTVLLPAVQSVKLIFRKKDTRRFVWELNDTTGSESGLPAGYPNNTKGNITIIDPLLWTIGVDAQPLPMGPGAYIWKFQITDIQNAPHTLLTGQITICRR